MTRAAALVRLAALAAGVALLFALVASTGSVSPERVRDAIEPAGMAAPIAFVALSALLTVCLFPGPLLAGASGLLFGTALGTPLSILAATLGATLAFTLSRRVAGGVVVALGGRRLQSVAGWIDRRGFWAVLYARIVPGAPYNLVNYAAGLTGVRRAAFAAATAIGVAPRAYAYTSLGGHLDDLTSPHVLVALGVLALMAVVGLLALRRDLRRGHVSSTSTGSVSHGPSPTASSHRSASAVPSSISASANAGAKKR